MSRKKTFDEQLDDALKMKPEFTLPHDFSDQVIRKIEAKRVIEEKRSAYLLVGSIIGFLLLSGICLLIFVDQETIKELMGISGWAVVIGLMVVVIQVLDSKLVRKKPSLI